MTVMSLRVLAVLLLVIISTSASSVDLGQVKVHGFLSQGFSISSGNNFLGDSTSGSFDSSMGAVNFLWSPDPGIYFSTQLISRNYGDLYVNEEDLALDYALVGVDLFANGSTELDLRAGFLKIPMGIYNETRDIPSTYSGVVLPQVIYPERIRNSLMRSKGAALEFNHLNPLGSVNAKAQVGKVRMSVNKLLDTDDSYVPDLNFIAWKVMYNSPENMFFAGMSRLKVDYETYRPNSVNKGPRSYDIFSAGLNLNTWTVTAEYQRRNYSGKNTSSGLFENVFEYENISDAYYVQLEKMFNARFSAFIRNDHKYDITSNGKTDNNYTNSHVIGANWRPTHSILIKAEYHNIEGGSADMIEQADNPDKGNSFDRYWDMFMLQFIYSF